MARNVNIQLRNAVLEFIKKEYYKNGSKPVVITLMDMAEGIGLPRSQAEKMMRMTAMLEKSGNIIIHRGGGSVPHQYQFVDDRGVINEVSVAEVELDIDGAISDVNVSVKKLIDYAATASKEYLETKRELEYLKQKLLGLELFSLGQDGKEIFTASPGLNLSLVIDQIKHEYKQKKSGEF